MNRQVMEQLLKQVERVARERETEIAETYAELMSELTNLMGEYFRNYEVDGKLDIIELSKYGRKKKLEKEINATINRFDSSIRNQMRGALRGQYQDTYYGTSYLVEKGSKAKLGYKQLKREVLDQALDVEFTGLTLNERLNKRRFELTTSMREQITRGLAQGTTYGDIAKTIEGVLDGDKAKANRIVRTEAHRLREKASLDSVKHAEDNGIIMKKRWNTVKDERVRDRHEELDGVEVETDGVFEIEGYSAEAPGQFSAPEMDINCRCFLTFEIVAVEKPQYDEIGEMSMDDWMKERLSDAA